MEVLYNILLSLYHFAIVIVMPFSPKARLFILGRKNWQSRLKTAIDPGGRYIWFHCASLGEFEQGRPVIEAIRNKHPEYKLLLSFFSPSGYEIRKNYPLADVVCYLPVDTPRNAALFLDIFHPEKVFFVKYEFWYNFIRQIEIRKIPLFLVSGIFRNNQRFFGNKPWNKWFRRSLRPFTRFFVQDQHSAGLLEAAGFTNWTISGDTRFDRVADILKSSQQYPVVDKFKDGKPVLIAGSTWKPDEELLVPFINGQDELKFIIAPHEVTPQNINRLVGMLKKPVVLFSRINETEIEKAEVILVDSIGILSSLYRYGDFAYIGGGFGAGIHNILEAATFGLPVFFGPNYKKFREACQLTDLGSAFPVTSTGTFRHAFESLIADPSRLSKAREISSGYVSKNKGSTGIILREVFGQASAGSDPGAETI